MDILQAIVLGIVQGLGEFLPISSTAHLVLVPYFFGWEDPGLAFDVALHAGTLVAVVMFFWKDWLNIFRSALQDVIDNIQLPVLDKISVIGIPSSEGRYSSSLLWLLLIATIPGALAGYFLQDYAEGVLRHPLVIAFALAFVGYLLYVVDKYFTHRKDIKEMKVRDAVIIGVCQAIAIIPGVSRSGATITAGLMRGLDREGAARFSFLLSTPIIFGASVAKFPELWRTGLDATIIVGILVSAISGYFAIKLLLRFVKRASYAIFFWYRLALALLIVLVYFWM